MVKKFVKVCEVCGREFPTRYQNQKYCSKKCRAEGNKITANKRGQLCWRCKNACGGCSWSQYFIPIKDWIAEPMIIKDSEGDIKTYKIKECPEFIYG